MSPRNHSKKKMAEYWGDFRDEELDFGGENEDYVELMLMKEDSFVITELTNRLPSRLTYHPWLLRVRNDAIYHILHTGRTVGVRKITVFSAVMYVDRFLSLMKIATKRFDPSMLLGVACLYMAAELYGDHFLANYECFGQCSARSIMSMSDHVVKHFGGPVCFVTPIDYVNYFLSKFCTDLERKEFAKAIAVQVIMSAIGDEKLMSLRAFVLGAAATLLASKPNILTQQMIQNEINALPQDKPIFNIPLDEMCSCYNHLLETNRHRLDINLTEAN